MTIQHPVTHSLRNVGDSYITPTRQVGDLAGYLQNAMVGAGGQSGPVHGSVQQPLCVLVQDTDFTQLFTVELMIRAPGALQLPVTRADNPPADFGQAFHPSAVVSQELLRHRRHFDVHVDAVEQRV